ncbi:hypothetical protein C2E23DRAFT_18846 [Lenzites betulinus]|nr:hypothetical protein C2E23DRAFT_18846 [Lenzites betulinus]
MQWQRRMERTSVLAAPTLLLRLAYAAYRPVPDGCLTGSCRTFVRMLCRQQQHQQADNRTSPSNFPPHIVPGTPPEASSHRPVIAKSHHMPHPHAAARVPH